MVIELAMIMLHQNRHVASFYDYDEDLLGAHRQMMIVRGILTLYSFTAFPPILSLQLTLGMCLLIKSSIIIIAMIIIIKKIVLYSIT